jgi:hypothetical protein
MMNLNIINNRKMRRMKMVLNIMISIKIRKVLPICRVVKGEMKLRKVPKPHLQWTQIHIQEIIYIRSNKIGIQRRKIVKMILKA